MRVIRHLGSAKGLVRNPVLTLGNFDGVHLGHRRILSRVVAEARRLGGDAVAITFHPHPAAVLAPERAPAPIASLRERLEIFGELGLDVVLVVRFTLEFSRIEPEDFVARVLVGTLGIERAVVGHSVSFGRNRRGDAELLRREGERFGFDVEVVGPVSVDGVAVSSTEIRRRLREGDFQGASRMLGRPYRICGRVVAGDRRGKLLGFPTANVRPRIPLIVPDGVYAVRVDVGGRQVPGIANIGRNPTFGEGRPRGVEAHLFGFDGDLYGRRIRVELVEWLRAERRFPSAEALVEQIRRDVERARQVLGAE